MANQQASNNSAKRTGIPDISEMHNDERRSERFPMLLTTTYGLNNSHTKRILVGLQTTKKGIFEPVVKLSGSNADGVYFDAESWLQFQENMGVMSDYLNANNKFKPEPVVIKISQSSLPHPTGQSRYC
ncbi:uncharacterized protein LOC120359998 [Solenopsis invicta]|uniref:uncharacterized protein LOC120359998 n=1 Tax=Solenopsis invicta TaxID=13686 RepID=UPI00193E5D45|nr:uncharacterized protein LOC120359998 [Solenopsis invicta]